MQSRSVVLVEGVRSPFGRGGPAKLIATRLDDTGPQVLRALLDPTPKVFQLNEVQRNLAADHDLYFSVPLPDYVLDSSPMQSML